jgi:primosomal protein N' (replication factor Y)
MIDATRLYCDVALPVPVDRLFTYRLPLAVQDKARRGCRILVPLGTRRLVGTLLHVHDREPEQTPRETLTLLDEEPALEEDLIGLAQWIAEYYGAPLGEVLRGMLPLTGEVRRTKTYTLTDAGREVARQLLTTDAVDEAVQILQMLFERPRSAGYIASKIAGGNTVLRDLLKRGWVVLDEHYNSRDPLRTSSERLEVEFRQRPVEGAKLRKSERELLAFLELHPGSHNLRQLTAVLKDAGRTARALARQDLVRLEPERLRPGAGFERPRPELNADQKAALDVIENSLNKQQFCTFLLEGVTGSGKTEVYMCSIEAVLAVDRNALLLVPEIALTPAVAGQFFHRFGDQVAILHSAFSDRERAEQWRRIKLGKARVVVGTRSGVFAPVQNLGLVIVDEEHDASYKQQDTPRYHGRDVALVRAKEAGAVAILGSATPSIETRYNSESGKYGRLRLPERIGKRPLPEVEIVDMRVEFLETKQQGAFSRRLLQEIALRLESQEQVMLLLNRRGFSSFMTCRSCGERLQCINCAVSLTHHRRDRRMLCHYCGYAEKVPDSCPKCDSKYIQFIGAGSERVEEELFKHFPAARIARLDRDTASPKGAFENILQSFRAGETDILVGTQMIAKGHDVPNVTLVGVVLADIGLSMPDFRAAERGFQLLTQAAGRAGRGERAGQVLIQTLNPEHYAIQFAAKQDYDGFYSKEIEFRRWLRYPPFSAFSGITLRAKKRDDALRCATEFGRILTPPPFGVRVLGPAEAPVPRLKSEYRYQLLIKAASRSLLRETLSKLREYAYAAKWPATAVVIDVDPLSLM